MKLTLRQAHKIVDKINARLVEVNVDANPTLSAYNITDPAVALDEAKKAFEAELGRYMSLIAARSFIRAQVAYANAHEVDTLVARRKASLDIIAKYRSVKESYNERALATPEALGAKVNAVLEAAKTTTSLYGSTDQITVSVMDKQYVADLDDKIQSLQLTIEAIEDQLTTANASTTIELQEDVRLVLVNEKILGE